MKSSTAYNLASLSSVFCQIFGHQFTISRKVTQHITEYECVHCKKQMTTNEYGELSELTTELEAINNTLQDMWRRRSKKRMTSKISRKKVA